MTEGHKSAKQESFVFSYSQPERLPTAKDGSTNRHASEQAGPTVRCILLEDAYREKAKKERARNLASAFDVGGHLVTR